MVYEYNYVNVTLLIQLAIEDYSYDGFYAIPLGTRIMWKVTSIIENFGFWIVRANVYRGESFGEFVDDFETNIYKNPSDLAHELYNGTGNELYFTPINMSNYLNLFSQNIPMLDNNFSYVVNDSVFFDYTRLGSNDTIKYTFNKYGILSTYQIYYNDTLAFSLELSSFSRGGFDMIAPTAILISSVLFSGFLIYFILKRRKLKKSNKVSKILKKIR